MKGKFLAMSVLASLLVSGSVYASTARLAVMGAQPTFTAQGNTSALVAPVTGALWYDDDYNNFYNPAFINDNKNYAIIEKGLEGGWFKSIYENFVYGIYLNRGAGQGGGPEAAYAGGTLVSPGLRAKTSLMGAHTTINTQRPIDLFFGGDTGLKWGAHVAWAYNRNQTGAVKASNENGEVSNRYWHFDFGAQVMGFEPFIGVTMFSELQNDLSASTVRQSMDEFNVGFRYKYEGWTPYFAFKKYREGGNGNMGIMGTGANQILSPSVSATQWGVGVGHDTKVADGIHVYKNIAYWSGKFLDDSRTSTFDAFGVQSFSELNAEHTDTIIPINVAIEGEATSWLTLRAGATYDLFNQRRHSRTLAENNNQSLSDKVVSNTGLTTFRVGSTLKFGKLHVDSAFGTGNVTADGDAPQLDRSTAGFDKQTFALLSASYHW